MYGPQVKAKVEAMPVARAAKEQAPLQAYAQPLASVAAAVARGQLPKAVEAIAQPAPKVAVAHYSTHGAVAAAKPVKPIAHAGVARKQMKASHVGGMKAAATAARAGPVNAAPVLAVAKPVTISVAAEKPVQAVAEPMTAAVAAEEPVKPVTPSVAAEKPVQAVAEPMSAAVAAEKPVMAVAHPVMPAKQVATAVEVFAVRPAWDLYHHSGAASSSFDGECGARGLMKWLRQGSGAGR